MGRIYNKSLRKTKVYLKIFTERNPMSLLLGNYLTTDPLERHNRFYKIFRYTQTDNS